MHARRPHLRVARVAGHDVVRQPRAVRGSIGLVFQEGTLDQQLTAEQNLRFHAVLCRVPADAVGPRVDRVLDLVALTGRRGDLVSTFSGGMARRLEIARGLLHSPAVIFLDEPTVGLDPQTRALMWEDVLRMREEEGVTVLLTTHYMDEAEYADRIAIIDHGRLVALDTPARLKAVIDADAVELRTADDGAALGALRAAGLDARGGGDGIRVFVDDGEAEVPRLIALCAVPVRTVHVHRPTLDDVFLHFTGRQIREGGAVAGGRGQRDGAGVAGPAAVTAGTALPRLADEGIALHDEARTVAMVWRRELIRFSRTRARILTGFVQPVLFLFVLGWGLNPLVGTTAGFDFRKFVFPGVVAMSVVTTAIFSAMSIVWDREFGFLREMLVAPVSRASLVLGKVAGGATIATAQGSIM